MDIDPFWVGVATDISRHTGRDFVLERIVPVGGGCISSACLLHGNGQSYFAKFGPPTQDELFAAEFDGLTGLARPAVIGVPGPVCRGTGSAGSYLVTEAIDPGRVSSTGSRLLGEQLARLHRTTVPRFGWEQDNFIGASPQPNDWRSSWIDFLRDNRLGLQLDLARRNGFEGRIQEKGETLLGGLDRFFVDYDVIPSLLHGDLWSGNFLVDTCGKPWIIDPAVHYGDRECDLAMTELFGGFPRAFYDGYNDAWPLHTGYEKRKPLYQLYHVLNHANLFGGGYALQAESLIDSLLSEVS